MRKEDFTVEQVSRRLSYNEDTGEFIRLVSSGPSKAGASAGCRVEGIGVVVGVFGAHVLGHRLAWFMTHGEWPGRVVHKDGDLFNNAIENLKKGSVASTDPLTAARLKALVSYSPEDGLFKWIARTGSMSAGDAAGSRHVSGYIEVSIDGVQHKAHRLAWLYMNGEWPESEIDHINGVRHDNRAANLRLATRAENMQNKRRYASNSSGVQGVCFHRATGKWSSSIQAGKKRYHLGVFGSKEDAGEAYRRAKEMLHEFSPLIRGEHNQQKGATI